MNEKMNKNKHEHVAKNNFCINLCYLVFDLVCFRLYCLYNICNYRRYRAPFKPALLLNRTSLLKYY